MRKLGDALAAQKRAAWVDWKDIPLTAEWQREILANIEAADNFLFIISPESAASANCRKEIDHAVANNKRMVPIFYRSAPDEAIPEALGKFQRIDFSDNDDFDSKFATLIAALDTDLAWVQMHTRLLTRAKEWEREGKDSSFLLRGKDLREAEQWVAKSVEKEPAPTTLHSQYILASRQAATKLQRIIIGAVAAAFVIAVGLAVYAFTQKNLAQRETKEAQYQRNAAEGSTAEARKQKKAADDNAAEATRQKNTAVQNEREAKRQEGIAKEEKAEAERQARIANSGRLATTALLHKDDQLDLASLLSIEASKTADTFEAQNALFATFEANPRLLTYLYHLAEVVSVAFSPDGKALASASSDYTVRLWDVASRQPLGEPLKGHGSSVRSVAFSPDGKTLASASEDKTVRLWDVASRQPLGEPLKGHQRSVYSVAFSPDGKTLASASWDKTVRLGRGQPAASRRTAHRSYRHGEFRGLQPGWQDAGVSELGQHGAAVGHGPKFMGLA